MKAGIVVLLLLCSMAVIVLAEGQDLSLLTKLTQVMTKLTLSHSSADSNARKQILKNVIQELGGAVPVLSTDSKSEMRSSVEDAAVAEALSFKLPQEIELLKQLVLSEEEEEAVTQAADLSVSEEELVAVQEFAPVEEVTLTLSADPIVEEAVVEM